MTLDIIGHRYGKLTVLDYAFTKNNRYYCDCKCDCGERICTRIDRLKNGRAKSCGCSRMLNRIGKRYGHLVITRLHHKIPRLINGKKNGNSLFWECLCDCGNIVTVVGTSLYQSKTISCGCERKKNFNAYLERIRKPFGEAAFHSIYLSYKKEAKRRRLSFELDRLIFRELITNKCFYCNSKPKNIAGSKGHHYGSFIYNGIDRVNNNIGYIKNNCVTCCKICNGMKEKLSQSTFIFHIKETYLYLKSKGLINEDDDE